MITGGKIGYFSFPANQTVAVPAGYELQSLSGVKLGSFLLAMGVSGATDSKVLLYRSAGGTSQQICVLSEHIRLHSSELNGGCTGNNIVSYSIAQEFTSAAGVKTFGAAITTVGQLLVVSETESQQVSLYSYVNSTGQFDSTAVQVLAVPSGSPINKFRFGSSLSTIDRNTLAVGDPDAYRVVIYTRSKIDPLRCMLLSSVCWLQLKQVISPSLQQRQSDHQRAFGSLQV